MASRTTELALRVVADVTDATAGLDTAAGKLDSVAGSAENLDGKMGAATGALGALSAGFELVGMEKYAAGLQNAAMATDFFSGVGQTATLILESTKVQAALARAQMVAHGIASRAAAAGTVAMTVAQRALNVAMRANPIGLLITAVTIATGLIVLLYTKSDTFRSLVNRVGEAGRAAFGLVKSAVGDVVGKVGDVIEWVGRLPEKFEGIGSKAAELGEKLAAPFVAAKNAVEDLVGWIANIDFPSPPAWMQKLIPGGDGRYSVDSFMPAATAPAAAAPGVSIVVQGALDPYAVAVQIRDLLARYGLATGVGITPAVTL